eukprot:Tbor_TRINITY_DN3493_c0_g1::TRINITY_DN3493_c0_g1_i1::g.3695::m.3695
MSPKRKERSKSLEKMEREASHELEVFPLISNPSSVVVDIDKDKSQSVSSTEKKCNRKARSAFLRRDVEDSHFQHSKPLNVELHAGAGGDYMKSIVFGGLDGITTTFAIIAAAAGAGEIYKTVLLFGISNVLADGFSMGFGEYISGNAEYEYASRERAREEWEVENSLDLEIQEMVELYEAKGLSTEDAKTMVGIISKDHKIFVDFMMVDELGLLVDLSDKYGPLKQGIVMFFSFVIFGMMPLFVYFGGVGKGTDNIFAISVCMTALSLLILGAVKGYIMCSNMVVSALLMLFNGCCSGVVSYAISVGMSNFLQRV